jgi:hypothetical protein
MTDVVRHVLRRFWRLLENDSVRPFITMYYIPWLIWSVLATIWFPPVGIIESTMGHTVYVAWVWMTIPGTLAPMIGLALQAGGKPVAMMSTPLLFRDWLGLVGQAGGHACMCILLLLFEISATRGAMEYMAAEGVYAGLTIFVVFILSPYVLATGLLSGQCLRKMWIGEQLKRLQA